MVKILGNIKDSGGVPVEGFLSVLLDAPLFDSGTNSVNLEIDHLTPIVGGVVDIDLPASPSISYLFRVLERTEIVTYLDSGGDEWTGPVFTCPESGSIYAGIPGDPGGLLVKDIEIEDKPLFEFRAILPDVASVTLNDLLPTGVTTEILDTSLARLAQIMVSDVSAMQRLASSLSAIPSFVAAMQQELP